MITNLDDFVRKISRKDGGFKIASWKKYVE